MKDILILFARILFRFYSNVITKKYWAYLMCTAHRKRNEDHVLDPQLRGV